MNTTLVATILVFVAAGVVLLLGPLVVGRLVRPNRPSPEKGEVYECGEQPIGSAWIQFDLRFYVVALLFVVFDVEIAFFFPWAVVFGSANQLANPDLPQTQRNQLVERLEASPDPFKYVTGTPDPSEVQQQADAMRTLAVLAFVDLLVFFGILLVGFAYLWKRGDLEWVRSVAAQVKEQENQSAGVPVPGLAEKA